VLVALLLPAIQAARESARRAQCTNQLKQIGLGIINFHDSMKVFPTGGSMTVGAPDNTGPRIQDHVVNGKPLGPEKQGVSWGYQILPYLELNTLYNITNSEQLNSAVVPTYVCPSRRTPVVIDDTKSDNPNLYVTLSDYVGAMPCGYSDYTQTTRYTPVGSTATRGGPIDSASTRRERFFGSDTSTYVTTVPNNEIYQGVIVRTPYRMEGGANARGGIRFVRAENVTPTISIAQVSDGTSHTLMVGEKFVRPDLVEGGSASDDRGWSDGWDPDTMRSTCWAPLMDSLSGTTDDTLFGPDAGVVNFGSSHPSAFNCVFADGSVHSINYDIDRLLFDYLGDREDGEIIDHSQL
jgi:prepilin-type processing-associated H-X9-DG protein